MKKNVRFLGTIHPHSYGTKMADGLNCVSTSFYLLTHFNGKNTFFEQNSPYRELIRFCHDFQSMWEEHLTSSMFMNEGESEGKMHLQDQEQYGELTLSDEGVRLFKNEDGWTLLVSLDLFDLTPFKVYKAIGRCLHFMDEFSLHYLIFEDDLIHRAERKYKEWLEKKESDIINNNKEDEDCPF